MEVKLFEVRDSMTFIPCIGIKLKARLETDIFGVTTNQDLECQDKENYLLKRCAFDKGGEYILFGKLIGGQIVYDFLCWDMSVGRTMRAAHQYVEKHWDKLFSGDVIDIEYILGETKEPKKSERLG